MHVHILGIGGTFMAGVALLARAAGHRVTGADKGLYPPMSTQLAQAGIDVIDGYDPAQLNPAPDCVIIGNAMSRGNAAVEYTLDQGLSYTSGPQWLAEHVLNKRWVLAVAGTHGKTTTASMLAWILEDAGMTPGFLIGGIPGNFGESARLGGSDFFVVEADEYDTAFFDKRSKFVHYRPRTLVLNNLEFDHADIFDDLAAIKRQFHHLIRTVPASGQILHNAQDANLDAVLGQGCWSQTAAFAGDDASDSQWQARKLAPDGHHFEVLLQSESVGEVDWPLSGQHNVCNGLAAVAAARHVGVDPAQACTALGRFAGVKRRMELFGEVRGIRVYDDFAHHPTAIATTLAGLRAGKPDGRIIAVLEPRSNTMRLGAHGQTLAAALADADVSYVYQPENLTWDLRQALSGLGERVRICDSVEQLLEEISARAQPADQIVIMSNGGFGGIHPRLLQALSDAG